jgi:RsmE family RNA methyltransferase
VNLILLAPGEITGSGEAVLTDARAQHLQGVLKVTPGQTVRIGVADGPRGEGTVSAMAPGSVTLQCTFERAAPPPPAIDLLLALPRPKVMKRLWAQLAALGVGRIILTNAARVERHYFDTHVLTPECFRPLLVEGLQQARDTRMPVVSVHRRFRILVEDELDAMAGDAVRLLAQPDARSSIRERLRDRPGGRVMLAIGPEGGWTSFEARLLESHGFLPAAMGARTLRSDTACIALVALARDALEASHD